MKIKLEPTTRYLYLLRKANEHAWADLLYLYGNKIRIETEDTWYRFSKTKEIVPWTLLATIHVPKGHYPLSDASMIHEIVHCLQYLSRGLLWTAGNLWLPWLKPGASHATIAAEQEAIAVEKAVQAVL